MSEPTRLVKQLVDLRDNQSCVRCGVSLWSMSGSRHHRKPRSHCNHTEKHALSNLILLCGSGTTGCHGWAHSHPSEAYKLGYLVHSWDDPRLIPIKTRAGWRLMSDEGTYEETKENE